MRGVLGHGTFNTQTEKVLGKAGYADYSVFWNMVRIPLTSISIIYLFFFFLLPFFHGILCSCSIGQFPLCVRQGILKVAYKNNLKTGMRLSFPTENFSLSSSEMWGRHHSGKADTLGKWDALIQWCVKAELNPLPRPDYFNLFLIPRSTVWSKQSARSFPDHLFWP